MIDNYEVRLVENEDGSDVGEVINVPDAKYLYENLVAGDLLMLGPEKKQARVIRKEFFNEWGISGTLGRLQIIER